MPISPIDHSTISKLPAPRRIKGQSTSGNLVKITLPNLNGAYSVSFGPCFTSDGSTFAAGGYSFNSLLTNDTAKPSTTTNDTDVDAMSAGEVRCLEMPAKPGLRNRVVFVWVDSSNGFMQIRYHGAVTRHNQ